METTVKVSCNGEVQELSITHAENLFKIEKKLNVENWKLDDPQFTLDTNGTITRTDNRADKKADKQKPDSKGD